SDDGGCSGNVLRQMLGQEPCSNVVVVADLVADNQAQLLGLVELGGRLAVRGGSSHKSERERERNASSCDRYHGPLRHRLSLPLRAFPLASPDTVRGFRASRSNASLWRRC